MTTVPVESEAPELLTTIKQAMNDKGHKPYIITVLNGGVMQYMLMNIQAFKNPVTAHLLDALLHYIHIDFDNLATDGATKEEIETLDKFLINLSLSPNWKIYY